MHQDILGYLCICRDIIVYLWSNKVLDHKQQGEHEDLHPISRQLCILLTIDVHVIEVGHILGTDGDHGTTVASRFARRVQTALRRAFVISSLPFALTKSGRVSSEV